MFLKRMPECPNCGSELWQLSIDEAWEAIQNGKTYPSKYHKYKCEDCNEVFDSKECDWPNR